MGFDDPQDLLVHYWVNVQDKQRLESGGTSVGVARGPYGGYGWGAGYGGGVTTYEYKEGTLILDLIEPTKKQLVWRATIVGTLQDSKRTMLSWVMRRSPKHLRAIRRREGTVNLLP